MATVLAATHLQLDELVALKILLPAIAGNAEAATRFEREARAAVKIKSEHVVRVLDVSHLEDRTPYLVMEHLQGRDLQQLVQEQGPVEPSQAAGYLIEACDAIGAAHALGIVHRDLKPANLYLNRLDDGTTAVKVLDFGISKLSCLGLSKLGSALTAADAALTKSGAIMGSPMYMAPEQMRSARGVDARTDIWALGCVLFELVTGRPPFSAENLAELCARVLTAPAPLPSQLRAEIPPELDRIILRCLAKSPTERYRNVAELAAALLPFAPSAGPLVERIQRRLTGSLPADASGSVPPPAATPSLSHTDTAWGQRTGSRGARRHRQRWAVGAGAVLLLGGALGGWLLGQHRPSVGAMHPTGSRDLAALQPVGSGMPRSERRGALPLVRSAPDPALTLEASASASGARGGPSVASAPAVPRSRPVATEPRRSSRPSLGGQTASDSPAAVPVPPSPNPAAAGPPKRRPLEMDIK